MHVPVLLTQMLQALNPQDGVYVDATFGSGGYSRAILDNYDNAKVIGIDRDQNARQTGEEMQTQYGDRFRFVNDSFGNLQEIMAQLAIQQIDGLVMDLGVSSMQIDDASRGFSFKQEGPLDMRMNNEDELTAGDIVNTYDEKELADIIYEFGDERKSRRIAHAIVEQRCKEPFTTTKQLSQLLAKVVGFERPGFDPATRTFQALRMFVNKELSQLKQILAASSYVLAPGARIVTVTFHSGEDKIVKDFFKVFTGRMDSTNRYLPNMQQQQQLWPYDTAPNFKLKQIQRKVIEPNRQEVRENVRSRSAKLRWAVACNETMTKKNGGNDDE